jgi:Uma2 family endonuclease
MSTTTPTPPASSLADADLKEWLPSPRSIYRLSVDQYDALVASGVFAKRDRFQLINGILVAKMTEHPPHAVASTMLWEAYLPLVPAGWHLRVDKSLRIPRRKSVLEPDLVMARGATQDYLEHHPGPADVALVVEVAQSSLSEDRDLARVYGVGGVPVYWIVNLVDRQIEVYTNPGRAGYRSRVDFKPGQNVPVVVLGAEIGRIAVDDILPRRRP